MVDVSQDVVITIDDCGSHQFLEITRAESEEMGEKFAFRMIGRVAAEDIKIKKETVVKANEEITDELAEKIDAAGIDSLKVRSVLGCRAQRGVCKSCYGRDLSSGEMVELGTVVGIIAAQAIGEPGTQLTMKTFHMGGVTGEDITSGLPRVEELFEARNPRNPAIISDLDGIVKIFEEKNQLKIVVTSDEKRTEKYLLEKDYQPTVTDGDIVKARQAIAIAPAKKALRSLITGKVKVEKNQIIISSTEKNSITYTVSTKTNLKVEDGDRVERGQDLTEGHFNLENLLKLRGRRNTERYIIRGVQEIYASQGQTINDKHIEIIVREMFSKLKVKDSGDSDYLVGQVLDQVEAFTLNDDLKKKGKGEIMFDESIMGITRVALVTDSFLSAASFQETTGVLIDAAVNGKIDYLEGLKENVIIGCLIPAGTGYKGRKKRTDYGK